MTWLFGQMWFLVLLAFLVGALVAWAITALLLPSEAKLERETGLESKGVFG